jgi:hypothetical protein
MSSIASFWLGNPSMQRQLSAALGRSQTIEPSEAQLLPSDGFDGLRRTNPRGTRIAVGSNSGLRPGADPAVTRAVLERQIATDAADADRLRQGFGRSTRDLAGRDPAAFDALAEQAFGTKGPAVAEAARADRLPQPAQVRFVDRETLNGSNGAYSPDNGGTVFLANDLRSDPAALQRVYDEEAAHHLDAAFGGADSRGDEGQIFAQGLAQGGPLTDADLAAARAENDRSTITVDGRSVEVENSRWNAMDVFNLATSAASWIPGAGDAVSIVSAAVNVGVGNYPAALFDVVSLVPGVGDAIGSAGKLLLQNRLSRELAGELARGLQQHGPRLIEGITSALQRARSSGLISRQQYEQITGSLRRQIDDAIESARRATRTPHRAMDGISTQRWDHVHQRHLTGRQADGRPWPDNPDLFAAGTTRAQLEEAARDVVAHGQRVSDDVQGRLQTFERVITVNGRRDRVRVVVDQDTDMLHTIFPVRR